MSRKQRPRRSNKATLVEQASPPAQRVQRVPNIRPGATNFQPLAPVQSARPANMRPFPASVINQMYQNFGPQANQDSLYSPGAPIRPIPGLLPPEGPRGFNYSIGYNIAQLPRSEEQYSFADLRAMASMYYGAQMCQQVWFDYISKLELVVEPRKELLAENMDLTPYEDDIQYYQDFFAYPDKDHDFHSWLQMAVRDQLEIDGVSIFVRKDRIGRPYSLDLIDSALIKPLITDRGRTPEPPYPAFEQFVHGVPAAFLTTDDLIYIKETERSDSVYGRSRVEKIMLYVTMALRKQTKDLARFTDGTLPEGFIIPSMDVQWSQEEIEAFEIDLNNLMAGNDEMRARLKVLPRGFTFEDTQDADIHMDLDEFILNVCAAGHGITMSELAFTADVNRATGEMQENVVYRRAMGPLMNRYSKLFTMILRKFFKETRFVVKLRGYGEVEDFQSQSTAYATLVGAGIQSPTQAAHAMNLPVYGNIDVPPYVVTKTGPIMVDDLADPAVRAASKAAFIAGASGQPAGSQGQQKNSEEEDEQDDEGETPSSQSQDKQPPKPGQKDDEKATLSRIAEVMDSVEESLRLIRARDVTPDVHAPVAPMVSKQGACDCAICRANNGKVLTDGHRPPYHDGCDCAAIPQSTQCSDAPAEQTGMMIAFMLDPEAAAQLAIPGGEPAEAMHVTLAYLGRLDEVTLDVEALRRELAAFASESLPLSGTTGGVGRFTPSESSDGKSPVIALVNVPGLQQFRAGLVQRLENIGVWYAQNFDYTPHITLIYAENAAPMPIESLPQVPLVFYSMCLVIGNTVYSFPFGGQPLDETAQQTTDTQSDTSTGQAARALTGTSTKAPRTVRGSIEANAGASDPTQAHTTNAGRGDRHGWRQDAVQQPKRSDVPANRGGQTDRSFSRGVERTMGEASIYEIEERESNNVARAYENTESQTGRATGPGRGVSGTARAGAQQADLRTATPGSDRAGTVNTESNTDVSREVSAEYRRWRARALEDAKAQHHWRGFTTSLIPEYVHAFISRRLDHCQTADDVRALFKRVQEQGEYPKPEFARDVRASFARMGSRADDLPPEASKSALIHAYQMTSSDESQLATILAHGYLSAKHAAYQRAASRARPRFALTSPWQPGSHDSADARTWGQHRAHDIAHTYATLLEHAVASAVSVSQSAPPERGIISSIGNAISIVKDWFLNLIGWKSDQVSDDTWNEGDNDGTEQFVDDVIGSGTDYGALKVQVLPEVSSSDFCADYAGKIYDFDAVGSELPEFPAHSRCQHYIEILSPDDEVN